LKGDRRGLNGSFVAYVGLAAALALDGKVEEAKSAVV